VIIGEDCVTVEPLSGAETAPARTTEPDGEYTPPAAHEIVTLPFGRLFGTRSGDKGGNANLGVWARSDAAYAFLRRYLSTARLKSLLPDAIPFAIERYELPNLKALNFYIRGILGEGVAASLKSDPQAKTLGEYLRVKAITIPAGLQNEAAL
jgi:hypothetical protein